MRQRDPQRATLPPGGPPGPSSSGRAGFRRTGAGAVWGRTCLLRWGRERARGRARERDGVAGRRQRSIRPSTRHGGLETEGGFLLLVEIDVGSLAVVYDPVVGITTQTLPPPCSGPSTSRSLG